VLFTIPHGVLQLQRLHLVGRQTKLWVYPNLVVK
jgi:hypothetical protein